MENTIENNKLIAEFMGASFNNNEFLFKHIVFMEGKNFFKNEELKFNYSWSWLMPVVEKIEEKGKKLSNISKYIYNNRTIFDLKLTEVSITTVYEYAIEFIKWYNQQKA